MNPVKITTRATNCVYLHTLSHLLSHAVPLQLPCVWSLLQVSAQQEERSSEKSVHRTEPPFRQALTYIGDVQWEPEQECVADQLGKQQTQRELDHALEERGAVNLVWD